MISHKELLLLLARNLRRKVNKKGNIHIDDIDREVDIAYQIMEDLEKETMPVKKFLFVEDGTVDTDELEEILHQRNPEIKLVVYRQGGTPPRLEEVTYE